MTSSLHQRRSRRIKSASFAAALVAALTLAPAAASWAADIDGGPGPSVVDGTIGDDTLNGDQDDTDFGAAEVDGSDDTINGNEGEDFVQGDGDAGALGVATVNGGNDTINGGDDDDILIGDGDASALGSATVNGGNDTIDGGAGDDFILGDGRADAGFGAFVNGGDDILYGGSGEDVIFGDGWAEALVLDDVDGGNDQLFGGAGEDMLFGQDGNDILCGLDGHQENTQDDLLIGGPGDDLACAVDDEIDAPAGDVVAVALAANDEELDDEAFEQRRGLPLLYLLDSIGAGISILDFDEDTGDLSFSAACDAGDIRYGVTRQDENDPGVQAIDIVSYATLFVNADACPPPPPPADDDEPTEEAEETAVLPDTGASGGLNAIGVSGLGLVVGGIAVLTLGSRRKVTGVKS